MRYLRYWYGITDLIGRTPLVRWTTDIWCCGPSGAVPCVWERVTNATPGGPVIFSILADAWIRYLNKCYSDSRMNEQGFIALSTEVI